MASTDSTFRVGGLASGLDTNSIISELVSIESQPISALQKRQQAMQTQVSTLGTLISKLSDLSTAVQALGSGGAVGTKVTSTNVGFSAVSGSNAAAGSYDVTVNGLASAAMARSQAFDSGAAPVTGGTLTLGINGTNYDVSIADGESLADVAFAVQQSGAPVNATVLSDGTHSYLSITNQNTGYTIGGNPSDALTITENSTGTAGQALGLATIKQAANASVTVDQLTFTRQSNTLTDVIPGVTLTLRGQTASSETLAVENDTDATAKNLTNFVNAYNGVMSLIQHQLQVDPSADRSSLLTGDTALRSLASRLQGLLTTQVGAGTVRTLADLGVKSAQDGTLSLDNAVLASAIARDPSAVNNLFSDVTSGLSGLTKSLVDSATDPVDGTLILDQNGINSSIKDMTDQMATMQTRVDTYQQELVDEFAAMEQVVSGLKATGNFLNQQQSVSSSGASSK
jgi:flagellar hook-associated protein 2